MPTLRLPISASAGQQVVLGLLLVVEIAVFAIIGTNFFSTGNALEILRLSVEVGLLAIALASGCGSDDDGGQADGMAVSGPLDASVRAHAR